MKSKIMWAVLALVVLIFFMLVKLPAQQVLGRIALGSNISMYQVEGSIWQGSMSRLVVNGLPVENLSWDINALALLMGKLSVDLNGGNLRDPELITVNGPIRVSLFNPNHIQAENLQVYIPADRALAKVPLPLPVQAGGRFKVAMAEFDFGPGCNAITGSGEWLNAWVGGTQGPINLGNFTANISCEDNQIRIQVAEPNLLGLSLVSTVSPDFKGFAVEGKFKPSDDLPNEVHQAGRFFGAPDAQGYTAFKL